MPIKIPADLPAYDVLTREGVMVVDPDQAARQDIRPLRIGLLNLMPKKIQTENQFARLIGATPLQIDFDLIRMSEHQTKNTAAEHMESFYRPFEEVAASGDKYDGLIITGAPIEHLDFDAVTYWAELARVFDWTQTHVHSTFGVCWGGMAMINHFHGVQKHMLPAKAFGCFRHRNMVPASPYLRGFSDDCVIPVSRWTEMKRAEIEAVEGLTILLDSDDVGPCLVEDTARRALYIFNHFEYDSDTLKQEYDRDIANGTPINVPCNYYPGDDPSRPPQNRWRSHAHLLYGNWVNQIYQTTPFDMNAIGC
ncbi:Homoserine O-acetyltransferase [Roseovarius sp. EC-HK134]|jgi:homoserine O-succinyltransferase|uniref:homoserine O-acetyltransferase MetA n=1 Tax=Roseovarius TaxID=74030 RepID=UPI0001557134|nr:MULTISPECIES: homoserine O-succinyltransferase [Roseovarius]AWZ21527.1 Homoserine O-succinyltransferase [Roseovarius sp. AK1035]EDM31016.1 homoserine O-succinyltransferase [Roseovarius sp. TM1035]MBW4974916.1 homoserine O-succinyltransferase [Roseovarius mucosus]VVT28235.1 Homoserine O-acetyltransferase [Roseovarius sp. EC-SD190]VVT28730.1 Homoserine O-acetyltransferase [Roseovarius sp. EC-HK134]|tara:strand:- start:4236 stop:5159 length:924 start_codon:yes stop_codon:yes gene_type:complete